MYVLQLYRETVTMTSTLTSSSEAAIQAAQTIAYAAPTKEHSKYISYLGIKDIAAPRPVVKDVLDFVCEGLTRKKADDKKKIRDTARMVLANLVSCIYEREWLAVPSKPDLYSKGQYLHDNLYLTHRPTMAILNRLVDLGWLLEPKPGNNLQHVSTMYCPTPKIEAQIFEWLYLVEKPFKDQYVWASKYSELDPKKKEKRYLDLEASPDDWANMQLINEHLKQQSYAMHGPQHLIYVDGDDLPIAGGRVYMGLQMLPDKKAKVRLNTLINEKPVVEIDFKANHLRMAAALKYQELPDDPYESIVVSSGHTRDTVKSVINRSLGSINSGQVIWGAANDKEAPIERQVFDAIMNETKKVYPFIDFNEGLGLMLQSLEGQIMIKAQVELIRLGITALPIHDALMVNRGEEIEGTAEGILKRLWSETLGVDFSPYLSKDSAWDMD